MPLPIATYNPAHQAGLALAQSRHRVSQSSPGNPAKLREEGVTQASRPPGCLGARRASLGCVVSCSCSVDKVCLHNRHAQDLHSLPDR